MSGFRIEITYSDGEVIVADFNPVIAKGGVFAELNDPVFFKRFKIGEEGRYIEWPNGLDFCADGLRHQSMIRL